MLGIWEWHTVRADLRLCVDLANEGMEFAGRLKDPGIFMEALFMSGETMLYRADFMGARTALRGVAQYDDRERTRDLGGPDEPQRGRHPSLQSGRVALAPGFSGRVPRGEPRDAPAGPGDRPPLQPGLRPAPHLLALPVLPFGSEVRRPPRKRSKSPPSKGSLFGTRPALSSRVPAWSRRAADGSASFLRNDDEAFRAGGARFTLPFQFSTLGEALIRAGQFEEALRALDEGLAVGEETDERCQEAELHRLKGELLRAAAPEETPPQRTASSLPSRRPFASEAKAGSCGPPRVLPASGRRRVAAPRPGRPSRPFTRLTQRVHHAGSRGRGRSARGAPLEGAGISDRSSKSTGGPNGNRTRAPALKEPCPNR